ncbi:RNA polymerase sigma factor [Chitinophaga varians]|uniref:RNA polymerase sigma factor n=1 Tax=Chitinophaga varians TaxID=2202339 RepID=UPI00165F17C0|nr:RNA polymerase sigma-70 factor [Chitinophaga varians]MBC9909437.1 RNA polymerase sigma-70 factor [Chitinophaga varians]
MLDSNHLYKEQQLLQRIAAGEEASFSVLVDIYWPRVYGHALAYAKSLSVAEELTQDVFMDIWNSREKLPAIENFANYLFIITRNRIFKAVRKKLDETEALEDVHSAEDIWLPDHQAEFKEIHALLLKGIGDLPPARRQVFTMSRIDGKSYEEICRELNISRNTVKEHIVKALNFLRNYLTQHGHQTITITLVMAAYTYR